MPVCPRGTMQEEYEAVLFVGPRCGQETYYQKFYSNFKLLRPEDVYNEHYTRPNLHIFINMITEVLRKFGKVVVDGDSLINSKTRTDIMNGIKRKIPTVVCTCCHFYPKYGELQCTWFSNWSLCREFINAIQNSTATLCEIQLSSEAYPKLDYSSSVALTLELEDFSAVHHYEPDLICVNEYQFTFAGLIFEYSALVQPCKNTAGKSGITLRQGMAQACQVWQKAHPASHIIVICQKNEYDTFVSLDFMEYFNCPVHCVDGGTLPLLSIVPWLQYLFLISLYHEGTVFVYHSKRFLTIADEIGARSVRGSVLAEKPWMCGAGVKVPPMIPSTVYVNPEATNSRPVLPLYPLAVKKLTNDSQSSLLEVSIRVLEYHLRLAMFFKDEDTLKSHEELYQSALILVMNDTVDFHETTPSSLMMTSRCRSHSRSPISSSGMGSSVKGRIEEYVSVDLSKEKTTEIAAQRIVRARSSSSSSSIGEPHPQVTPKKSSRSLPSWINCSTVKAHKRKLPESIHSPQRKILADYHANEEANDDLFEL